MGVSYGWSRVCIVIVVAFVSYISRRGWVDVVVVFPFIFIFSPVLCSAASTLRRRSPLPFRIVSVVFSSLLGCRFFFLLFSFFFPLHFPKEQRADRPDCIPLRPAAQGWRLFPSVPAPIRKKKKQKKSFLDFFSFCHICAQVIKHSDKMSVLSQFCLARWKSVDSITPTALVYNLSRLDLVQSFMRKKLVKLFSPSEMWKKTILFYKFLFVLFCLISDSILTCSDDDETSNSMEFSKVRYYPHTQIFDLWCHPPPEWFKQTRCEMWETWFPSCFFFLNLPSI